MLAARRAADDSRCVLIAPGRSDGTTGAFTCDIVGGSLVCAPVNGTTSAVRIGPSTYCEWPYTVTASIHDVSPGGFFAMVQLATQASPTSNSCMNALGVCMGTGTANFVRVAPTPAQPSAPPPNAVVKRSAPI